MVKKRRLSKQEIQLSEYSNSTIFYVQYLNRT